MNKPEYVKKYQANRDAIMLRPAKEDGERYRSASKAAGMSTQGFIFAVLDEYLANHPTTTHNSQE